MNIHIPFQAKPKEGQIEYLSHPDQIRFLLITSCIIQRQSEWNLNPRSIPFYQGSMKLIREWVIMSDEEIINKYEKLPIKV